MPKFDCANDLFSTLLMSLKPYLLIGDNHFKGSAIILLKPYLSEICALNCSRPITLVTEALWLKPDGESYTEEEIQNIAKKYERDSEETEFYVDLIKAGVKVVGTEIASCDNFSSKTEVKSWLNSVMETTVKFNFDEGDCDLDEFIYICKQHYAVSDKRLIDANEAFVKTILDHEVKGGLTLFIGGAGHIPRLITDKGDIIDPGMVGRLGKDNCTSLYPDNRHKKPVKGYKYNEGDANYNGLFDYAIPYAEDEPSKTPFFTLSWINKEEGEPKPAGFCGIM